MAVDGLTLVSAEATQHPGEVQSTPGAPMMLVVLALLGAALVLRRRVD